MLELQQELLTLSKELRTWMTELMPVPISAPLEITKSLPIITKTSVASDPVPQEIKNSSIAKEPEEFTPAISELAFPQLREWAKGLFLISEPLTPVVCLGDHPLLVKLASAISEKFLPAMCCSDLPPLDHPLLKLILIPLPLTQKLPELKHLANLKPHDIKGSVLLLHPLEVYMHHSHEKRLLWNIIQKLPLFC